MLFFSVPSLSQIILSLKFEFTIGFLLELSRNSIDIIEIILLKRILLQQTQLLHLHA